VRRAYSTYPLSSKEKRENIMKGKPAFDSILLFPIVLFLLMIAGKAPVTAGSGLPPATGRESIVFRGPDMGPKINKKVTPVYPELAKRACVSGKVILAFIVDEEGNVTNVSLKDGHPFLNDTAINAVKQWKFAPTFLNGEPVPTAATVQVIFNLDKPVASRIDLPVAEAVMQNKSGQSLNNKQFIRQGKVDLELTVADKTAEVSSKLKSAGFEIISWPEGSKKAIGRIAIEKLDLLLNIDAVQFIAPHLR
jgi:TonB family protein